MWDVIKKGLLIVLMSVLTFFAFVFLGGIDLSLIEEAQVDEYGYTLDDDGLTMEQLIEYYGGQEAYIYDDVYDDTYLYLSVDDELHYYIDDDVSLEYILIFEEAIGEFNDLGFITITYEITDVVITDGVSYDYGFVVLEYQTFEDDMLDAMAYNEISWDESGDIIYSAIHLSTDNYYLYEDEVLISLLIHEIAHTFGLVDLYDDDFNDDSIMYYMDHELMPTTFTEFDIYNLRFMYE